MNQLPNPQQAINELYKRISSNGSKSDDTAISSTGGGQLDDNEIRKRMLASKNGNRIRELFEGKWQSRYGSQSEADQGTCNDLAWWTGGNAEQMDRMFRQSGLMRDKWDRSVGNNETYGQRTIRIAIRDTKNVYDPTKGKGKKSDPDLTKFMLEQDTSDHGNALCVDRLHGDRFGYSDSFGWVEYVGTHWKRENAEYAVNRSITETLKQRRVMAVNAEKEKIVKSTQPNTGRKRNVRDAFRDIRVVSSSDFDNDSNVLNCLSGVINLRTGKLLTHEPSQRFTYCIPVEYAPKAKSSLWEKFLGESVGNYDEIAEWLQMAHGYSITGHTREEILFYKHGPTRSGKGTHDHVMLSMLGEPLSRGVSFNMFTKKRDGNSQNFDLAPLKPTRFIAASESGKYQTLNEAVVKTITGGDRVMCAYKGRDMFDYLPQFKIWLSSNHAVKGDVLDDAFWARLRVIEFPNSHLGSENKNLKYELTTPENLKGILAYCVAGAKNWYSSTGGLVLPEVVKQSTQKQRDELDHVGQWLDECCKEKPDNFITNDTLIKSYSEWCEENVYKPYRGKSFAEAMKAKGFEQARKYVDGTQKRGYKGLEFLGKSITFVSNKT